VIGLGFKDFLRGEARTKIAEFYSSCILRNHNIVWFQVSVDQLVPVQITQGDEKLSAIQNNAIETESNIATKLT